MLRKRETVIVGYKDERKKATKINPVPACTHWRRKQAINGGPAKHLTFSSSVDNLK